MRPVVIVHGAWHQPAHYQSLADRLRGRGATVSVPDIGMLTLAERTAVVQDVVDSQNEPPVVVAHSYGGASAGAVRRASHLVFLSAWVLDTGETGGGWLETCAGDPTAAGVEAALSISADGRMMSVDPARAVELFYADCSDEVAGRAVQLLRPDLLSNFSASPADAAWRDTPSTYVTAADDRTWPHGLDAVFAARCAHQKSLATGHSAFLSRPGDIEAEVRALL